MMGMRVDMIYFAVIFFRFGAKSRLTVPIFPQLIDPNAAHLSVLAF
jgi:hypothetical protein